MRQNTDNTDILLTYSTCITGQLYLYSSGILLALQADFFYTEKKFKRNTHNTDILQHNDQGQPISPW